MEYIEGETLAERIATGPIPVDEVIPLFIQIAEGLGAAHEKGIIHRHLKPANIKIGPDGKPKILDFGLAKEFLREAESAVDSSQSPTLTKGTAIGVIMGTAGYMSPEQARAKPVDKRTDIWAFGCCVYEALSGQRPFHGEDVAQTLASVLKDDVDWRKLPSDLTPNVSVLLRRCMERDPRSTLQDIGDARVELAETLVPPRTLPPQLSSPAAPAGRQRNSWKWVVAILAGIGVGVLLRGMLGGTDAPAAGPVKLSVEVPAELYLRSFHDATNIEISPDGQRLFVLAGRGSNRQVYMRSLSERRFQPVPGTEGAEGAPLFVSPDGEWVGFYRAGELWKARIEGDVPLSLLKGPLVYYPHWAENGWIYFVQGRTGVFRIPESGGEREVVTKLDRENDESTHGVPMVLPGAKALIFSVHIGSFEDTHLETLSLETGRRSVLIEDGLRSFYVPSGHLFYGSGGSIFAAPFDLERLEVVGPSVPVVSDVETDPSGRFALYALSSSGTLLYTKSGQGLHHRRLVWKHRDGTVEPVDVDPGRYEQVRVSPDGRLALVTLVKDNDDVEEAVVTIDLARGVTTQLPSDGFTNHYAVFSPRGNRIAFSSNREGQLNLFTMPTDGSSPPKQLRQNADTEYPESWSPDGRYLAFRATHEDEDSGIFVLPLNEEGAEPLTLVDTSFIESDADFSPDGRWIAYSSSESGRREIYIKHFLADGGEGQRLQVSSDGGWQPVWSRDGSELFFRNIEGSALMVVDVTKGNDVELGRPRILFEEHDMPLPQRFRGQMYDVAPDGRFLMLTEDSSRPTILNVVLNWTEELKRLVPTNK